MGVQGGLSGGSGRAAVWGKSWGKGMQMFMY